MITAPATASLTLEDLTHLVDAAEAEAKSAWKEADRRWWEHHQVCRRAAVGDERYCEQCGRRESVMLAAANAHDRIRADRTTLERLAKRYTDRVAQARRRQAGRVGA